MKPQVTALGTATGTTGNRHRRPDGNRVPPLRGNRSQDHTTKETHTMPTATLTPAEVLLEERRKAAVPMLLALATTMASSTTAVPDAVTLAHAVRINPPPDDLLAAGLEALAQLAHDLADALTDGPQR